MHYNAVLDYVRDQAEEIQDELYANIRGVVEGFPPTRDSENYDWLAYFILAGVDVLEQWATQKQNVLGFDFFLDMYKKRFSQKDKYVDTAQTYNAYTLLNAMDIHVCPYCDDEYFDIIHPVQGKRRTMDFDHFHPKDPYKGLAMCFYNLIPSGKDCNFAMNTKPIQANPYHPEIESWSRFEVDMPVGANLDSIRLDEFSVKLITSGRMSVNNKFLAIEERYNNRKGVILRFLIAMRNHSEEAEAEMQRLGISAEWIASDKRASLGLPYPENRGKELHQKLRFDITGY